MKGIDGYVVIIFYLVTVTSLIPIEDVVWSLFQKFKMGIEC